MIREIAEIAIVIGLAVTGVAVAIYHQAERAPVAEMVVAVPAPPPPPAIEAEAPQDIVEPTQAVDQIEQHLERIQERLDRIEQKTNEGKK